MPDNAAHILEEARKHSRELASGSHRGAVHPPARDRDPGHHPGGNARESYATIARRLARELDPDDWPFIALALQHRAPIWTNDHELIRHSLKRREYYRAIDTIALEMLLQGVRGMK